MRKSDRAKRLDYKEFHLSGRLVHVVPEAVDVEDITEGVGGLVLENTQVGAITSHEESIIPLNGDVSQLTDVPPLNEDTPLLNSVATPPSKDPLPLDNSAPRSQDSSLEVIPLKEVASDQDVQLNKELVYPHGNQVSTPSHSEDVLTFDASSPSINEGGLSFNKDIASFSVDTITLGQQYTFGNNFEDIFEAVNTDSSERTQEFRISHQDHSFIHTPDSDSAPFLSLNSSFGTDTEDLEVTAVVVDVEEVEVLSESAEVEAVHEVQAAEALKMTDVNELVAEEATISEDIDDFLDENIVKEIGNAVEDFDRINHRVEDLRSAYRGKHKQLKTSMGDQGYQDTYADQCEKKLNSIKNYIKDLKQARKSLRDGQDTKAKDVSKVQQKKFSFLRDEIEATINKLTLSFSISNEVWNAESDEKISKRRTEITEQVKEVTAISTTIK